MVEYGKIPREKHMVFRVLLGEIDHHFPPKLRETQGNLKKKKWPNPGGLPPHFFAIAK